MVLKRRVLLAMLVALGAASHVVAAAQPTPPSGDSALEQARAGRYVIREAPSAELRFSAPQLPDLGVYTADAARARIGQPPKGRVSLRRMVEVQALQEFVGGQNRLGEWARRQTQNPLAIVVEGGLVRPAEIAAAIGDRFAQIEPGVFLARLPIIVMQDATLLVDESVRELRLSEESGAFLVNDGRTFIIGSRVLAWRERANGPARYEGGKAFRPFIVSWGGAEIYLVNSYFESFGYEMSKSYGISISQYSPNLHARIQRPPARGWVIGSTFVDLWYGFYCYEAENVPIIGNTYRDSVVYGIDPHDRSHGLIIADNRVHGTKQKHGIIISREVNDSWIVGNRSWDNALSGIVIDRASVRNVIADNVVYRNRGDGITIYESSDNLLWRNQVIGNARHGIRIRNSTGIRLQDNHATANGLSGVFGHIKDLSGTDRDLRLDPFEQNVALVIVGGSLLHNRSSPVAIDRPLSLELHDIDLLAPARSGGIRLSGVLAEYQHQLLDLLVRRRVPVVIEPAGGAGRSGG